MFDNVTIDGLMQMSMIVIVALAILGIYLAVELYKVQPAPKRKPGRPRKN